MTSVTCGQCGGELDGRFCGDCGADSQSIPPKQNSVPTVTPSTEVSTAMKRESASPASEQRPDGGHLLASGGGGLASIGRLLEEGWKGLTGNVGDWVINFVVTGVILGAVGALFGLYDWLITDETGSGPFSFTTKHPIRPLEILLLILALVAVTFIIYAFDQAALRIARGERPIVNDVWTPRRFVPYLVMAVFMVAIFIVSWVVPFAGPIVIGAALLYAPFFVVDENGSGVTSLFRSTSTATSPGLVGRQILFSFILGIFSLVGVGIIAIGIQIANAAGADSWPTKWRDAAGLILLAVGGVVYLIALAVTRMSAARAYIELRGNSGATAIR